jgi:hypothetical protein
MFLIATYIMRPRYPHKTSQKGWMNDPENVIYDEQVGFVKKLRTKDTLNSNVILDLANKKLVKCSVGATYGDNYAAAHEYFYENYKKYLDELGYPYVTEEPAQAPAEEVKSDS